MKISRLLALAGCCCYFPAPVAAQDYGCIRTCFGQGAPLECSLDWTCICSTDSYIQKLACCLEEDCSPTDLQAAVNSFSLICQNANVPEPLQSATCSVPPPEDIYTSLLPSISGLPSATATATTTTPPPVGEVTPAPDPTNVIPDHTSSNDSSNNAWIAGAVIGPLAAILLIVGLIFFIRRRRHNRHGQASSSFSGNENGGHKPSAGAYLPQLPAEEPAHPPSYGGINSKYELPAQGVQQFKNHSRPTTVTTTTTTTASPPPVELSSSHVAPGAGPGVGFGGGNWSTVNQPYSVELPDNAVRDRKGW